MCRPRFTVTLLAIAAAMAALAGAAHAIGTVSLDVEQINGRQFSLHGLVFSLSADPANPFAELTAERLTLPAPVNDVANVSVRCARWGLDAGVVQGRQCALRGENSLFVELRATVELRYDISGKALSLEFDELPFAGGTLAGSLSLDDTGWKATARGTLQAEALRQALAPLSPVLDSVEGNGEFDVDATFSDRSVNASLRARDIAFANELGTAAADALSGSLSLDAKRSGEGAPWQLSAALAVTQGEAFFEPVYLNFFNAPLTARVDTALGEDWQPVGKTTVAYRHEDTLHVEADIASMTTRPYRIESADITMQRLQFPQGYLGYVRGFLVGMPLLNELQTKGQAHGFATIRNGLPQQVSLVLDNVGADDPQAGFAVYDVAGQLQWRSGDTDPETLPVSKLRIGGGFLANVSIGESIARLVLHGSGGRLLEPLRLPIFSGALQVNTFSVDGLGSDDLAFDFEAELEPIGLRRLTTALGWPVFPGQLSGSLPLLSYKNGQVTVGGTLEARAFDGAITLEDLRIEQPFGIVPELDATIRMRNLDLALLTDVFTIGRIEGRLDGDIEDLKMIKGQPVAFDARFYTSPSDTSRRRISQRAVGSISGIAGDSRTPALSSGIMQFFSDFAYESLGINCRLEADVCNMSGIQPADRGYYLVKGRSLPRIDVIGFTSEVEWTRLVKQVQQAIASGQVATGATNDTGQ
ncbi:MAG: hypothetical protein AAFN78_14920 [Pseudomonadota bacterium]